MAIIKLGNAEPLADLITSLGLSFPTWKTMELEKGNGRVPTLQAALEKRNRGQISWDALHFSPWQFKIDTTLQVPTTRCLDKGFPNLLEHKIVSSLGTPDSLQCEWCPTLTNT